MAEARFGFPYETQPTGWFQIGWSHDVLPGHKVALYYFDTDLVLYRGETGDLHLFEAHCPHLGAHLGCDLGNSYENGTVRPTGDRGFVIGDDIVCPFHGWRFDSEGRNVDIPYSSRTNNAVRLKRWHVREAAPIIYMWHDAAGEDPLWDPPQFSPFTADDWYPPGTDRFPEVRMKPTYLIDNQADVGHLQFVHSYGSAGETVEFEAREYEFFSRVRGPVYSGRGATTMELKLTSYGVGLIGSILSGHETLSDMFFLDTATPIDRDRCDLRHTFAIACGPGARRESELSGLAKAFMGYQHVEFVKDMTIWENMRYVQNSPFTPEESRTWMALRRWYRRFYPHEMELDDGLGEPNAAGDDDLHEGFLTV